MATQHLEHPLWPHAPAPYRVGVTLHPEAGDLILHYRVEKSSAQALGFPLVFSAEPAGARRDGLWAASCAELFVMTEGGHYREFNFAPSGAFACYDFSGYRTPTAQAPTPTIPAPRIRFSQTSEGLAYWEVALCADALPQAPIQAFQCSVVLKSARQGCSFWALAHPPLGPADFHDPACFSRAPEGLSLFDMAQR